jgi:hypothetical protein
MEHRHQITDAAGGHVPENRAHVQFTFASVISVGWDYNAATFDFSIEIY